MSDSKLACFGIPSVFSFSSTTCVGCPNRSECLEKAHEKLRSVEETPEIKLALITFERYTFAAEPVDTCDKQEAPAFSQKPKAARPSRAKRPSFELTQDQQIRIEGLSKKAAEMARKVFQRGDDAEIRIALRAGKEPLVSTSGYRSLKLALNQLKRGFSRQELKTCFQEELGWSTSSSWNEVSLIWSVLPAIGVAVERDERLVVAPIVMSKN